MRVGDLRRAIADVDDNMVVLVRVSNEDGDQQFMCSPQNHAMPDPGCGETEMFILDGTDGECEHGLQAAECKAIHDR